MQTNDGHKSSTLFFLDKTFIWNNVIWSKYKFSTSVSFSITCFLPHFPIIILQQNMVQFMETLLTGVLCFSDDCYSDCMSSTITTTGVNSLQVSILVIITEPMEHITN